MNQRSGPRLTGPKRSECRVTYRVASTKDLRVTAGTTERNSTRKRWRYGRGCANKHRPSRFNSAKPYVLKPYVLESSTTSNPIGSVRGLDRAHGHPLGCWAVQRDGGRRGHCYRRRCRRCRGNWRVRYAHLPHGSGLRDLHRLRSSRHHRATLVALDPISTAVGNEAAPLDAFVPGIFRPPPEHVFFARAATARVGPISRTEPVSALAPYVPAWRAATR